MTNYDEKLEEVFCRVMGIKPQELPHEKPRDQVPYWKSLKHINLIVELEKSFAINIPSAEAVTIDSYQKLRLTLGNKLGATPVLEPAKEPIPQTEPAKKKGLFAKLFS